MGRDVRGTGLEVKELSGGNAMEEFDEFLACDIIFILVLSFNGK